MSKQPKKTRRDTAGIARENLEQIIGEKLNGEPLEPQPEPSASSKSGAAKGGNARAKKLSSAERSEIARKAALVRWRGQSSSG